MYLEWTSHLKDPKEKSEFEKEVLRAKDVLDRLKQIILNKENTLDRIETSIQVYDTPNWDVRQAHKNGNRETLMFFRKLVDIDQQRTNND